MERCFLSLSLLMWRSHLHVILSRIMKSHAIQGTIFAIKSDTQTPHPFSRFRGYLCVFPTNGHPLLCRENWRTLLRAFPHNIHPLSRKLFPIDSLSREHYGDPYSFSFLLFSFLRAREIYVFYHYPRGVLPHMQWNKGPIPFSRRLLRLFLSFFGSFWKTPHIFGDWFKTPPFLLFSGEYSETNGQKYPFPRNGNTHATPLYNRGEEGRGPRRP